MVPGAPAFEGPGFNYTNKKKPSCCCESSFFVLEELLCMAVCDIADMF